MNYANLITSLRIFLVPIMILVFFLNEETPRYCLTIIFFVASVTDYLDGYVARKMNQISITIILFMVFSAVLADFLAKFGYPFWVVFIGTFVLRAIVSYPVMQLVNPNVLKNMVHAVGDTVFNIAVVIHVFIIIVDVLNALNIK